MRMNSIHHPFLLATPALPTRLARLGSLTVLGLTLAWGQAHAQAHHSGAHGSPAAQTGAAPAADSEELTEGEVRRWDARTGKLTLRHGEIKSLGMPPMTMVFALQDPSQGTALQPGKQVRFRVEERQGALVITHLELTR
jgi:Cu/Ag efflux protein CusF